MRRIDFLACYDKGRRLASRQFVVFVYERHDGPSGWRVGMAVTKKIGSAVERNRVKRVVREFFRHHQDMLPPRVDMVVIPKKHIRVRSVGLASVSSDLGPLVQGLARSASAVNTAGNACGSPA